MGGPGAPGLWQKGADFRRSGFGVLPGLNVQSRLFPEVLAAWRTLPAVGGGGAAGAPRTAQP